MVARPDPASFWDGVWAWADSAGLLVPRDDDSAPREVPRHICDGCPICQGAAILDQVNPQLVAELTEVVRGLVIGVGSALAAAADQRHADPGSADPASYTSQFAAAGGGEAPLGDGASDADADADADTDARRNPAAADPVTGNPD